MMVSNLILESLGSLRQSEIVCRLINRNSPNSNTRKYSGCYDGLIRSKETYLVNPGLPGVGSTTLTRDFVKSFEEFITIIVFLPLLPNKSPYFQLYLTTSKYPNTPNNGRGHCSRSKFFLALRPFYSKCAL